MPVTAVPSIAADFHVPSTDIHITMTAYFVTVAMCIPLSGWLTVRFGDRAVFCSAIAVFTLASALCALSPDLTLLTLSRIHQGIGGAMMFAVREPAARSGLDWVGFGCTSLGIGALVIGLEFLSTGTQAAGQGRRPRRRRAHSCRSGRRRPLFDLSTFRIRTFPGLQHRWLHLPDGDQLRAVPAAAVVPGWLRLGPTALRTARRRPLLPVRRCPR
ncbi:MFS transporter [Arthrobacter sp. A5]|uniref:MFS transporter n=1 Tax=Arthrobacter sp. A5 TaxID=576926 RepID=UPI003DA9DCFB